MRDVIAATAYRWRHHVACLAAISFAALDLASDESRGGAGFLHVSLGALATYAISALLLGGWRFAMVVYWTFWRDVRGIAVFLQMKMIMRKHVKNGENVPSLWSKTVKTYGDKTCFYFENQTWSFHEVNSTKYLTWLRAIPVHFLSYS